MRDNKQKKLMRTMNQIIHRSKRGKIAGLQSGLRQALLSFCVLLAAIENLPAQVAHTASACKLLGTDTVTAGTAASFTLSPCTAVGWTVSCGTIAAQSPGSVTVNFTSGSCGTAVITATGGGAAGLSKTVTILSAPVFSAGSPTVTTQAIAYNKAPNALQVGLAAGGLCEGAYSYQWFSSADNTTFTLISGASGQNYQPGPLTATTYFRRQATCSASGTVTTNTMTVTVSPSLSGASLNLSTQVVNYDSTPVPFSVAVPGSAVGTSYQWQSASNASFSGASNIVGANANTYAPGNLTSTTYFRAIMILHGDSTYSSPAVVTVYPVLNAGSVNPAIQTVAYDSLPALLTCAGFNGGAGDYSFFWYSSPDGNSWSPVPGVSSAGYDPGKLTATTWFRVLVISNGLAVASSSAVINVTPQ